MIKNQEYLSEKASYCLDLAKKLGATDISVVVSNSISESVNFRNKRGHKILFQKTKELLNEYSAILVNSKKHSHVKSAEGQALIDWLIDQEGQSAIDAYRMNGEQLFFSSNH